MNTIKIIIPFHSFVDLITNSSSEIFISATDKTVETVKKIINNLTGDNCEELFDIKLVYREYNYATKKEECILVDSEEGRKYAEENANEEGDSKKYLLIESKDKSKRCKDAADAISAFIDTYSIYERYNG